MEVLQEQVELEKTMCPILLWLESLMCYLSVSQQLRTGAEPILSQP